MRVFTLCWLVGLVVLLAPPLVAQEAITADVALARLKDGNARFAADKPSTSKDLGGKRRAELAKGQHPYAIVLTCADSRLAPELIFDQGLGEIFVLRVAGNVTDAEILGSMEYAVDHFHTPLIVILGHETCGAIRTVVEKQHTTGNLQKLLERIHVPEKLPEGRDEAVAAGVKANVLFHAQEVTRQSPVLKDFASSGRVRVVAGIYAMKSGEIDWLELPDGKEKPKP